MRDVARAFGQSWPDTNPRFVWPPPWNPKGPDRDIQASFGKLTLNSVPDNTVAERAAARAVHMALARAARLQRRAETLDLCGLREAAGRDRATADAIREAAT
jgi:hypothetical protein